MRRRVFTYVTHRNKLLVLDHVDYPELQPQIPGGTIEENETPRAAALREAEEETGLAGLVVKTCLGEEILDLESIGRDETIHAWFFHLILNTEPPIRWHHTESDPHDKGDNVRFELYWLPINPQPKLGGYDGIKYTQLCSSLQN